MTEHRYTNQVGIDLVKGYEGFSSTIYICPAGYRTVGYGHLIKKGSIFDKEENFTMSRDAAESLLKGDLCIAEKAVLRHIEVPLSDNQFAALVSFTFNLGTGSLQSSTLRRKLNRKEYEGVPAEFKKWVFAGGKKLNGLIKRREAEANLFQQ